MHIRGSRGEEIGYTLEGASMTGAGGKVVSNAIPEALEAVAVQVGGYDASIGNANGGMVQQSLKTGGSRLSASVLMEGMQGGDAWAATGDNDITATFSGPIGNNIRFFGAVRKKHTDNYSSNSRWFTPFTIADGTPMPDKIGGLTESGDMVVLSTAGNYVFRDVDHDGVYTAPGTDADGHAIGDEANYRGMNNSYAFDNEQDDLSINGSLQWDMNPLVIRLGGSYNSYTYSGAGLPIQGMFNTRRHENAGQNYLLNAKATYFLNTNTYIRANFSQFNGNCF